MDTEKGESKMTNKNISVNMPVNIMDEVRQLVAKGDFPSINSFVASAVTDALKQYKRKQRSQLMKAALTDKEFFKDCAEIQDDFKYID